MTIETKTWPENEIAPPAYPYSKWNVKQWFLNVEGIDPLYTNEKASWSPFRIWFTWNFIRNPMFNFFRYVIGVEDRLLRVTGPAPVFQTTWTDVDPLSSGWKWSIIRTGWLVLPFVSYEHSTPGWVFYFGWLPSGGRFGAKLVSKK